MIDRQPVVPKSNEATNMIRMHSLLYYHKILIHFL
ncbi:hypothetical protein LCGC14_0853840 [marine sediment metagenome]|uniref:Uncharacterized protein n=1 Tax=marine sediment metagenome TaxID=412755 RepID=A0A0F9P9G8_9ZZZZ